MVSKLVWEEQLCSWVLILYPCSHCRWVHFELDGSKDILLIWIRVHLFLLPSESLLCFPFHSAIISSIMLPRHSRLYLPFVVVVTARQQIAFCWVLLHQTSMKCPHALIHIHVYTTHTYSDVSCFVCYSFLVHCHCFHLFLYFFILCFVDSWMAPAGFMAWPVWMILLLLSAPHL